MNAWPEIQGSRSGSSNSNSLLNLVCGMVLINKVLLEHGHTHCVISLLFITAFTQQLTSAVAAETIWSIRDKNIYHLSLYRKSLPNPDIDHRHLHRYKKMI